MVARYDQEEEVVVDPLATDDSMTDASDAYYSDSCGSYSPRSPRYLSRNSSRSNSRSPASSPASSPTSNPSSSPNRDSAIDGSGDSPLDSSRSSQEDEQMNNDNIGVDHNDVELQDMGVITSDIEDAINEGNTRSESKRRATNNSKNSKTSKKKRTESESDLTPIIHRGKSLMNNGHIDIDTDSEDDMANNEMLRIIDDE